MSKENEIYRYEKKFKHNIDIKQILTMLRLNENFIFKTYPDRIVNSLYIDSYSFDCYYDNVNGNNERIAGRKVTEKINAPTTPIATIFPRALNEMRPKPT